MSRLQLEVKNTKAVLEKFIPDMKKEASGSKVPIAKLKLSMKLQASSLAFLSPDLEAHYYNPDAVVDLALGTPLRDGNEVFPHKRGESMVGATAKIDYGLGTLSFVDAIVDDISIHPMNGGIVIWFFTLTVKADEVQAGKLYMLQEQEVRIASIEPPEDKQQKIREAA